MKQNITKHKAEYYPYVVQDILSFMGYSAQVYDGQYEFGMTDSKLELINLQNMLDYLAYKGWLVIYHDLSGFRKQKSNMPYKLSLMHSTHRLGIIYDDIKHKSYYELSDFDRIDLLFDACKIAYNFVVWKE